MKQLALILCLITTNSVFCQTQSSRMTDIDKICREIDNNLNVYQKIKQMDDSNGSRYEYMDKNGKLKLVTIEYKDRSVTGEYTDKKVRWYFSNDVMIYSQQVWTNIPSHKIVDNEKFYMNNNNMIAWIKSDGKSVDKQSTQFKDVDTKLYAYGAKLRQAAYNR